MISFYRSEVDDRCRLPIPKIATAAGRIAAG